MKALAIGFFVVLGGCSSHYKVLYTLDDTSRPSWAKSDSPQIKEADAIHFIGVYETSKEKETNLNAVKKASELKAWEEISKYINAEVNQESRHTAIGKMGSSTNITESFDDLIYQASKSMMKKASVTGRWYRVVQAEENGREIQKLEYFTKITMSNNDLQSAIESAEIAIKDK